MLNELYPMFYCRRWDDVTSRRLGLTCMKASLLWFSLHNILRFLSGVGTAHAMQFLSTSFETAVHHWFTCIRDVFFKNFTPVKWMLHPQACRLLLFVASPMGISESFRVNMSLSETVAPSKTDQNIEMRHLFWFSGLAKSTSELLPVCHHYIPLHWKELQKLIDQ